MGMSSVSSVSLTSLSAAQEIRVRQIITWLLDIREADHETLGVYHNGSVTHISRSRHDQVFQYHPLSREAVDGYRV
jgi:hypothetical protein